MKAIAATQGLALFDTTIGWCGIAWGGSGVLGVQLPEGREPATRARLSERFPHAREAPPPPDVRKSIEAIVALLSGKKSALETIVLDMQHVPPFHRRVYEVARTIPPGVTVSYGEIASRLGAHGSARAVGQALGRNPFAIVVPCHRVLAAGGKMGGFSANGGVRTKLRLLSIESVHKEGGATAVFEGDGAFGFDPATAVEHLRAADPALARLIDEVGPFRMELTKTSSLFVALAESIVYQQLTAKAAGTIFARVCALLPRPHEGFTAEQVLRIKDDKLRGAGLSAAKTLALKDLARKVKAKEVPELAAMHGMDNEDIIARLTEVRGIGRWTVEMLLMFRLARPDVLPVDDYGIKKVSRSHSKKDLPTKSDLEKRGARWAPYRTVASWYLWRAVDLAKRPND